MNRQAVFGWALVLADTIILVVENSSLFLIFVRKWVALLATNNPYE
jgi:hypothetical protein